VEVTKNVLSPEIAELLAEFLDKIKGKSMSEMIPVLTEFKKRLPKDIVFTDDEKNMIVEEALSSMPDEERNRYKTFLKMMKII